jgi:hypothetical protein
MSDTESEEPLPEGPFTILGVTRSGKKFRPSDWTCRLAGPYGKVDRNVVRYHPDVQPIFRDGNVGLQVNSLNPAITRVLHAFARANDLIVVHAEEKCPA